MLSNLLLRIKLFYIAIRGGLNMVAVSTISFLIGEFVGMIIMALCVAAHNEEDRRERDADNFKS